MSKRPHIPGQLGLFRPPSYWKPPTELPDLRGRVAVAIDSETKDNGLATNRGPGWALGPAGYICGVSWAADGSVGYAPIRHPETECFPLENVMRWLDDLFKSGTRIIMHNSPYDCGWFGCYGASHPAGLEDTLAAAVMLGENEHSYSLDACCARAGVPGKDATLLREAVRAYGGNPAKPAGDLWRVPARYAAPYAEQDGAATLALWNQQEAQLKAQAVWDAYRTEIDLIPMVVAMRRRGIRIDVDRAKRTGDMFRGRAAETLRYVSDKIAVGRQVTIEDLRSPQFLERLFTAENIPYPRTPKGRQGSFGKEWMERYDHWLPRAVVAARSANDAADKFIDNYLLSFIHRGRIHAEVHQFKSDEGGTKSHRFSYSEPPLQQMPTPDKDPKDENKIIIPSTALGLPIRQCFLPEQGEVWAAPDFSGQEVRIAIHFAALCKSIGVQSIVDEFTTNPRTDYHAMVAKMVNLSRSKAKIINFGLAYGKGKAALAEDLGVSMAEAEVILNQYHSRLPYIKSLEDTCKNVANTRGYIRLIDGARMRYDSWDGPYLEYDVREAALREGHKLTPCSLDEARTRQTNPDHPWSGARLRRADTRKSLNNLVQGSAARQTKIAMLRMWQAGYTPLVQMHDEICTSISRESQLRELEEIMITAVPLKVPVVVDAEIGPSWGEAKLSWKDYVAKHGAPT